jgi:ABC-type uncharacterized transport system permease subunit
MTKKKFLHTFVMRRNFLYGFGGLKFLEKFMQGRMLGTPVVVVRDISTGTKIFLVFQLQFIFFSLGFLVCGGLFSFGFGFGFASHKSEKNNNLCNFGRNKCHFIITT